LADQNLFLNNRPTENGGIYLHYKLEASLGNRLRPNTKKKKETQKSKNNGDSRVAQAVERLPGKNKAPSSNPSTAHPPPKKRKQNHPKKNKKHSRWEQYACK
jgi:hypothetical protein